LNLNFKLFFKYILFNTDYIFLKYLIREEKNLLIFISHPFLYYLTLHLKLSSLFYSTQLIDLFSYEIPLNKNKLNEINKNLSTPLIESSLIVYQFHSIIHQQRIFIFLINSVNKNINKNSINSVPLSSITELFLNANWLEREVAELHGVFFAGKKDLRNLLLQYGDTSAPMRKSFPTIGTKEIFYDSVNDLLIQTPVSVQF
jgi:NADH:ubiquinone oxidoreductase subunit C